jgi:hypothetical protein
MKVFYVGPFYNFDSRVGSECPVELAVSHIDCCYVLCAVLEKTIRESAGRGPDIKTSQTGHINVEVTKRFLKFDPSTAYIGNIPANDLNVAIYRNRIPCLGYFLTVDQNLSSKDQCLGTLTALGEASFD